MNAHRSRSLGMAALIFILISLTAAVFHGAAPVRAEDATTTPTPVAIDENTARVTVKLYTDEYRTQELKGAVASVSTLYGAFSANFKTGEAPTPGNNVAVYKFPDTIAVDDSAAVDLMAGTGTDAVRAGTWEIKNNKAIFTFDKAWLEKNPANIYVAANFSFQLKNKDVGSGSVTPVVFPGMGKVDISTKDGNVKVREVGGFLSGLRRRSQGHLDRQACRRVICHERQVHRYVRRELQLCGGQLQA